ncbi:unnamed protein product, partial [Durusdinium trenchii]
DLPKASAEELVKSDSSNSWSMILSMLVIFLFALFGFEELLRKLFSMVANRWKEEEEAQLEEKLLQDQPVGPSHVAVENVQTLQNEQVVRYVLQLPSDERFENESEQSEDDEIPPEEWSRWSRLKMEVQNENSQRRWRQFCQELELSSSGMDRSARTILSEESVTSTRWKKFTSMFLVTSTTGFEDEQIRQWHRMWNDNLMFLGSVNKRLQQERAKLLDHEDFEKIREKYLSGLLTDRSSQTPISYDYHAPNLRARQLPATQHGAWLQANELGLRS